jgi:hypothetical protein
MAPAEIQVLIADLVRAGTDPDLVGRVAAAIVTGDVSVTSQASRGVTVAAPHARSAGAIRTARWRAKRRLLGLGIAAPSHVTPAIRANGVPIVAESQNIGAILGAGQDSRSVTVVTAVTSRGDGVGQKEMPPHPLKKNTKNTKRFGGRRRSVTVETPPALFDRSLPDRRGRLWVDAADPVYLDLQAHSPTRSLPGSGDGWWFSTAAIAAARERLGRKVAVLPVRGSGSAATGPPEAVAAKA